MKKLLAKMLMLPLVFFTVVSCSDSENPDNVDHIDIETGILGKWFIQGGTINDGAFEAYSHSCEGTKDFQEFFSNGTINFTGYGADCQVNDTSNSTYSIEGNILTITDEVFGDLEYVIESLTQDTLILKSEYNSPEGEITERAYFSRN